MQKHSLVILSGFSHCLSDTFLERSVDFAKEGCHILFVDGMFTLGGTLRMHLERKGIHFFEWGYYNSQYCTSEGVLEMQDQSREIVTNPAYLMLRRMPSVSTNRESLAIATLRECTEAFGKIVKALPQPRLLLSYDIPHSGYDFAICCQSSVLNVPRYYFRSTGLISSAKTLHKADDWHRPESRSPMDMKNFTCPNSESIRETVEAIYLGIADESEKPMYSKEKTDSIDRLLRSGKKYVRQNIGSRLKALDYLVFLKREYLSMATICLDAIDNSCVVYFLQREPEASTMPEALPYRSQIEAICSLRRRLPDRIKIFIKEHPDTFKDWETIKWPHIKDTSFWRPRDFYSELLRSGASGLLPTTISSKRIIGAKPLAVCTLTGSVYTEAINAGIPCICHPAASYSRWPGTVNIFGDDIEMEIHKAIVLLMEIRSDRSKVASVAKDIIDSLLPISLRSDNNAEETIDKEIAEIKPFEHLFYELITHLSCT